MEDPEKYAKQYQRILTADLAYPVEIMQNKKALWECLDGLHRVAKAKVLGMRDIQVRKVLPEHIPLILEEESNKE